MSHRPLILMTCLLALAGCATKVKNVQPAQDFQPSVLAEGPVVLGGFVAADRLGNEYPEDEGAPPKYDVLAQTDAWSPLLFGGFLQEAPELSVWPWPALQGATDDTLMVPALETLARSGLLNADHFEVILDALPGARFLALVRMDGNEVSLHEHGLSVTANQRDHDGRDLHANDRGNTITTRRRVTVTLEIYDLRAERSLWAATVRHDAKELYNPAEAEPTRPDSLQAGDPYIRVAGTPHQGPPLPDVLEAACAAAVRRMFEDKDES